MLFSLLQIPNTTEINKMKTRMKMYAPPSIFIILITWHLIIEETIHYCKTNHTIDVMPQSAIALSSPLSNIHYVNNMGRCLLPFIYLRNYKTSTQNMFCFSLQLLFEAFFTQINIQSAASWLLPRCTWKCR